MVEIVPKVVEVMPNVFRGCAEGGGGCAEGAWRLCGRCLEVAPNLLGGYAVGA